MRRYVILTLLVIAGYAAQAQLPMDSVQVIINREVADRKSKSIIVGMIDANGRQILSAGAVNDTNPAPPDGNTVYEIGSITKVFTTLLLADMSLDGQVGLSDPVSKYLPDSVKTPVRNGREITLLTLATHRSGLPRNAYNIDAKNLDNPFAEYRASDLYDYISHIELSRDVDAKWQYSNIGYALLGQALSLAAHREFDSLVVQDICRPLGMHSTVFSLAPALQQHAVAGYTEYGKPAPEWDLPLAGGGGLRSTMNDMLTFAAANLGLMKTGLQPAIELYHRPQARKDGQGTYMMTMGWTLWNNDGRNIVFKDGGTGGTRTFIGIDKKNKRAVVVLSTANSAITDIGLHILDTAHALRPYPYHWHLLDTLRATAYAQGADSAAALYRQLKAAGDSMYIFNENQLNYLGNELRNAKRIKDAIKIYELNMGEYPKSAMVYESLAETYKRNNDPKTALAYFEKARETDPQNPHWAFMINKMKND